MEANEFNNNQQVPSIKKCYQNLVIPKVCVTPNMPKQKTTNEINLGKKPTNVDIFPANSLDSTSNHIVLRPKIHCSVCNLDIPRELSMGHTQQYPHNILEKLRNRYSPEVIATFCSVLNEGLFCSLCNICMANQSAAESHLASSRHTIKLQQRVSESNEKDIFLMQFKTPDNTSYPDSLTTKRHCTVCNLDIPKEQYQHHAEQYPHKALVMLRNRYSPEIVTSVYSVRNESLFCSLCSVCMTNPSASESHLSSSKHTVKFQQRVSEFKRPSNTLGHDILEPKRHCELCNLDMSKEQSLHHAEQYPHKVLAMLRNRYSPEIVTSVYSVRNERLFCSLCSVCMANAPAADYHLSSSGHTVKFQQRVSERPHNTSGHDILEPKKHCEVCNLDIPTEQSLHHAEQYPHKVLAMLRNRYSPEIVAAFCSVINEGLFCSLCSVCMDNPSAAESHLSSPRHIKKLLLQVLDKNEDKVVSVVPQSQSLDNNVRKASQNLLNRDKLKTPLKENLSGKNNDDKFYCYLCEMGFKNRLQVHVHCMSFPHKDMLKWKVEAISSGVSYAKYWLHSTSELSCTLCSFTTSISGNCQAHIESSVHKNNFKEWCVKFADWNDGSVADPKFFYCKICDKTLDGTSQTQLHYDIHTNTSRIENNKAEKSVERSKKEEREEPAEIEKNEAQILEQIMEMLDALYFSKSIPFDLSLKYLKKVNGEVTTLKEIAKNRSENQVDSIVDDATSAFRIIDSNTSNKNENLGLFV